VLRIFFALEFLDNTDSSLAFAVFGAVQYHSYPVAVFPVSSGQQSAAELLLCFDGLFTFFTTTFVITFLKRVLTAFFHYVATFIN